METADEVLLMDFEIDPVPENEEVTVPDRVKVLLLAVIGETSDEEGVRVLVKVTVPVTNEDTVVELTACDNEDEDREPDVTFEVVSGLTGGITTVVTTVVTAVVSEKIVVTPCNEVVVFGKKIEEVVDEDVEAVPVLSPSDEEAVKVVPLDVERVPVLPESEEDAEKVGVPPVGPTTTELMLVLGKGDPYEATEYGTGDVDSPVGLPSVLPPVPPGKFPYDGGWYAHSELGDALANASAKAQDKRNDDLDILKRLWIRERTRVREVIFLLDGDSCNATRPTL